MKSLLGMTTLALIVSAGSPVTAQVISDQQYAGAAFAQAQPQRTRPVVQRRNPSAVNLQTNPDGRRHSDNPAYDVYDTQGNYISSDPDMFIRNELMRAPPGRDDN